MKKIISDVVQYPFDAQSDSFFNAISSVLLPVLGFTDDTPYYCAQNGDYCINCGGCGTKTTLQKHHLMMYHALLTATGVAFCFDYPEDDDVNFHSLPGIAKGWRWTDDFIGYIMDLCGCTYTRLQPEDGETAVFEVIKASVDKGYPTAIRLGGKYMFGSDTAWSVVTGYDGKTLLGIDANDHYLADFAEYHDGLFALEEWYGHFIDVIVITGRKKSALTTHDVLSKIAETLAHPSHPAFQQELFGLIDSATEETATLTANIICSMTGVPIEARWHAAETFCSIDNVLTRLIVDKALKKQLSDLFFGRYIMDNNDETHGVCWQIWGILGCGPDTGYAPASDAGERLMRPGTKDELKRLWTIVFDNDRAVLEELREILKNQ